MKKRSLMILPLAAAFALTGCSGSDDNGGTETAPEGTQTEQSTQSEETAQAEAASGEALDGAQVKSVVEALVSGAENAQVLDDDTLKAQAAQTAQMLDSIKVEPEECKQILNDTSMSDVGDSAQAAGVIATDQDSTAYQVISLAPEQYAKVNDLLDLDSFQGCENLVQEIGGQKAEVNVEIVDAPQTNADKSLAIVTTTSSDATPGMRTVSVSLQGVNANNLVTATHTALITEGADAPATDQKLADLATDMDRAFAEIDSKK